MVPAQRGAQSAAFNIATTNLAAVRDGRRGALGEGLAKEGLETVVVLGLTGVTTHLRIGVFDPLLVQPHSGHGSVAHSSAAHLLTIRSHYSAGKASHAVETSQEVTPVAASQ